MTDSVLDPVETGHRDPVAATARVGILGAPTKSNVPLQRAWQRLGLAASLVTAPEATGMLEERDVALVRLDVLPSLDGVEPGLGEVGALVRRGVRVLNRPSALIAVHDKLVTQELLAAAGVAHPVTVHVTGSGEVPSVPLPCVVKPRFGSWGTDVFRCETDTELRGTLRAVADRPWFRRHGALVQELVPSEGTDLRVLAAGGRVVGAARRLAAPGEWRTNVTLGGTLEPVTVVPSDAAEISLTATALLGADLACVDVLPTAHGPVVLELNGAADFDARYSLPGEDVYVQSALALDLIASA